MTKRLGAPALVLALAVSALLGSCAHGQGSKQAFCDHVKSLSNRAILLGRFDPSDTDALAVYREDTAKEMSQLERSAPREIKPDVAAVADLTAEVAQLSEKYGKDRYELQQRLYSLVRQRVGAAGSVVKVANYAKNECGVDISPRRGGQDTGEIDPGEPGAPGSPANGFGSD